jgi:para-aminobenzoate synthetase component 1
MFGRDYQFWMGNRHATKIKEFTDDPSCLEDGGFWAVMITFEGKYHFAKFKKVVDAPFEGSEWSVLERPWRSSIQEIDYISYVHAIREEISAGGVYQVNACRELSHLYDAKKNKLSDLFARMQYANPAPFASYMKIPGFEIASASPERFLSRDGKRVITSPIKGTIRWDQDDFGEKDQAENLMIVDLMRNDLSQIARDGSVEVSELFRREKHPGLTHLVSDVQAEIREGATWAQILAATIPPGSVSGAPKSSALSIISKHEPTPRGPYCGALGWIQGDRAELAVGIRTFWNTGDEWLRYGTGAGITWGSEPGKEWEETQLKARTLIAIAGGTL